MRKWMEPKCGSAEGLSANGARNQPMSVKAIYPRLAMMLNMAIPPTTRSELIMASVPNGCPARR